VDIINAGLFQAYIGDVTHIGDFNHCAEQSNNGIKPFSVQYNAFDLHCTMEDTSMIAPVILNRRG
jgi:hypothetical protein